MASFGCGTLPRRPRVVEEDAGFSRENPQIQYEDAKPGITVIFSSEVEVLVRYRHLKHQIDDASELGKKYLPPTSSTKHIRCIRNFWW